MQWVITIGPMGIVVGHCVRPSRVTFLLWLFKDFSYQPEIWWDDAQYHVADRH